MDGPGASGWIRRVPNLLSTFRIGAAFAFPFVHPSWRLPLVLAGALSDGLDGYVARRFGVESTLGGLLDAVADKVLTLVVLVTLTAEGRVDLWHLPLLLARDLVVLFVCLYFASRREWRAFTGMSARLPGKATTVFLFAWFVAALLPAPDFVQTLALGLAAACSVVAAADYLRRFVRALGAPRDETRA